MLGGAVGATAGKLSGNVLCNGPIAFVLGAASSVVLHAMLYVMVYAAARLVFQAELEDYVVGGYEGDALASTLGGIAGLCGAIIVTIALPSRGLQDPHAFALCWSVAAVVPLLLTLAILWRARWLAP